MANVQSKMSWAESGWHAGHVCPMAAGLLHSAGSGCLRTRCNGVLTVKRSSMLFGRSLAFIDGALHFV